MDDAAIRRHLDQIDAELYDADLIADEDLYRAKMHGMATAAVG